MQVPFSIVLSTACGLHNVQTSMWPEAHPVVLDVCTLCVGGVHTCTFH